MTSSPPSADLDDVEHTSMDENDSDDYYISSDSDNSGWVDEYDSESEDSDDYSYSYHIWSLYEWVDCVEQGPPRLVQLPEELISLIATHSLREDVLKMRLTCHMLHHSLEHAFGRFMTEPRVQFSRKGIRRLLDISRSRFAAHITSIVFSATKFDNCEFGRLKYNAEWRGISSTEKAQLKVLDQSRKDVDLYIRRPMWFQRRLCDAFVRLEHIKVVSLDLSYCRWPDEFYPCMPFEAWSFKALLKAISKTDRGLNRLSLTDKCGVGLETMFFSATMDESGGLNDKGALGHLDVLELNLIEQCDSDDEYTGVLKIISYAPNIKKLTLRGNKAYDSPYHIPVVLPYLSHNSQLPRLEFLELTRTRISYASLERLLHRHAATLVEVRITDCVFYGNTTVVEDVSALVHQTVSKAHLARNVRFDEDPLIWYD